MWRIISEIYKCNGKTAVKFAGFSFSDPINGKIASTIQLMVFNGPNIYNSLFDCSCSKNVDL